MNDLNIEGRLQESSEKREHDVFHVDFGKYFDLSYFEAKSEVKMDL